MSSAGDDALPRRDATPFWAVAAATAAVTTALLVPVLRLWRATLHVPFAYTSDANSHAMMVKAVVDHGWYEHNPSLGAPFAQHFADYPMADNAPLVLARGLALFGFDYPAVVNLLYMTSYVLVGVAAAWVLRRLRLSAPVAIVIAVLYAFLPYHWARGETHLFLSAYVAVPFGCYLVLRSLEGEALLRRARSAIGVVGMCVLVGSAGSYYAVFTVALLGVAVAVHLVQRASRSVVLSTLGLAAVVGVTLLANMAPDLLFDARHGPNEELAQRTPGESEAYGLKLSAMLLPPPGYRFEPMAAVAERYHSGSPVPSEPGQSLGLLGAVGLLGLLALPVLTLTGRAGPASGLEPLRRLSGLALASILLATVGGLSSLVAVVLTPQLRAWNRISVFVGFFALVAVGIVVDQAWRGAVRHQRPAVRRGAPVVLALLLLVGVVDQTNASVLDHRATRQRFADDAAFFEAVEQKVGPQAMVFQLPHVPFPEHPPVVDMVDYDHLRGYLHSDTLRWSYGAMKGRPEGAWAERVVAQPVPELVRTLAAAGFAAVYVDRFGFADRGADVERQLAPLSSGPPVLSRDGRLVVYDIRGGR